MSWKWRAVFWTGASMLAAGITGNPQTAWAFWVGGLAMLFNCTVNPQEDK